VEVGAEGSRPQVEKAGLVQYCPPHRSAELQVEESRVDLSHEVQAKNQVLPVGWTRGCFAQLPEALANLVEEFGVLLCVR
jgi:hypothetical protein